MDGCCAEPGKGGLYKTTSECTEASKNLRGSVVAAATAPAAPVPLRNQLQTDIATKGASVFLNKMAVEPTVAPAMPTVRPTLQNLLPLPVEIQAVSQQQQQPEPRQQPMPMVSPMSMAAPANESPALPAGAQAAFARRLAR